MIGSKRDSATIRKLVALKKKNPSLKIILSLGGWYAIDRRDTAIDDAAFEPLGPHRRGVGCLYIKRLDDVDREVLDALIRRTVETRHAGD